MVATIRLVGIQDCDTRLTLQHHRKLSRQVGHIADTAVEATINEIVQRAGVATRAFSLTLCGFGLKEDEAVRIVAASARDIIKI